MAEAPARTYHHGNLRRALIDTALAMLEQVGPEELSLRAVAAAAGVSRAAPYAHFADKNALVAAVAQVGFERLAAEMLRGGGGGGADAETRFLAVGRGYVRFALGNPNLFKLMFSAQLDPLRDRAEVDRGSRGTYELFRTSLAAFVAERAPHLVDSQSIRTMAWSIVHGLSLLLVERRLPVPGERHEALAAEVTAAFTRLLETAPSEGI
jgi:AcrR family transcriptional regulator